MVCLLVRPSEDQRRHTYAAGEGGEAYLEDPSQYEVDPMDYTRLLNEYYAAYYEAYYQSYFRQVLHFLLSQYVTDDRATCVLRHAHHTYGDHAPEPVSRQHWFALPCHQ